MISKWSNSKTQIDARVDGVFSLFGDMVTGSFVKIVSAIWITLLHICQFEVENKELQMKWRMKTYPVGHFALVTFTFKDQVRDDGGRQ